jgi:hypothetical protein
MQNLKIQNPNSRENPNFNDRTEAGLTHLTATDDRLQSGVTVGNGWGNFALAGTPD